jgi:DNA-directed RNA polymerase subunit M
MRLVLPNTSDGRSKPLLVCPKCGYQRTLERESPSRVKIAGRKIQENVMVIGEEEAKLRTMPITKMECPKCANREAYWWMVQTRGADESPTQFFRCTKCSYTWREQA